VASNRGLGKIAFADPTYCLGIAIRNQGQLKENSTGSPVLSPLALELAVKGS
jgi:hypothetical protein